MQTSLIQQVLPHLNYLWQYDCQTDLLSIVQCNSKFLFLSPVPFDKKSGEPMPTQEKSSSRFLFGLRVLANATGFTVEPNMLMGIRYVSHKSEVFAFFSNNIIAIFCWTRDVE